jgi:hypothetical protein
MTETKLERGMKITEEEFKRRGCRCINESFGYSSKIFANEDNTHFVYWDKYAGTIWEILPMSLPK